ncbi:MAG: M13-type metalloendopeptidase [Pseudomonadota bacterium]
MCKRSWRSALLSASALVIVAACSGDKSENAAASEDAANLVHSAPELGSFGITLDDRDLETKPGNDFFRYVNGEWIDTFEIPDDFSSYSSFTVLFERSEERVQDIIEGAAEASGSGGGAPRSDAQAGSDAQKVGAYYSSFLDTQTINALGLGPARTDLARIAAAQTHGDIIALFADASSPWKTPIGAYVDVDSKQTDRYIVYLTQAGLGLPNKTYYEDAKFADKLTAYRAYVEEIFTLAEIDDAGRRAENVVALEKAIADAHWTPEKRRNRDLTYNFKTLAEIETFAPGIPWRTLFAGVGLGEQDEFVLREDDALQQIAALFAQTDVAVWRDYLTFHLLNGAADVLPTAFDDAQFAFFGTELRGTPKQRDRWKRGVAAVNGALGEAVGKIYVEQYFPASSKAQMQELVANLRRAMAESLEALEWMGDATKQEAFAKLEKFTPKIGYPDKWKDYSALTPEEGDAYGNLKRVNEWRWRDQTGKLGGPIDKTEWLMTPQTVNAYYAPNRNEIVFPAAILQAPFFDPAADPAVNYGAIGAVIGHEIGHGFDDQGRKSDGDGVLRDWWTDEDAANFKKITEGLGAQYAQYEPLPGFKIKPDLTMGENIGDLGGLSMAYYAYKLSLNGEEAPVLDGLSGDQRFFLAWAQVWKRVVRDEALKNQIETDPHSPARYRVNGVVRNMNAWYEAFAIDPEDALYLPPEDRVKIW